MRKKWPYPAGRLIRRGTYLWFECMRTPVSTAVLQGKAGGKFYHIVQGRSGKPLRLKIIVGNGLLNELKPTKLRITTGRASE
jgi:hypothetical protein